MNNDQKSLVGKIDISGLSALPEKHEYETAKYFMRRGLGVTFIDPSGIKGSNNPDFIMGGKIWETKSPTSGSKSSIEHNFRKAMKQSDNIIFDLRRLSDKDEVKYIHELRKRTKLSGVRTLLVITKSGGLLTLRGRFDII